MRLLHRLFDLNCHIYGDLITKSTLKHTQDFLHNARLSLSTSHAIPQLLREDDEAIMDGIIACTHYSAKECTEINLCQIYLQVITVADIEEGSGTLLTIYAAEGKRDPT